MKLTELIANDDTDRAVSPVIGVILMVAITVILAAVIGTFVLGLGDQVQQTSPNAQFAVDYDSAQNGNLTITHEGGGTIKQAELNVSISDSASDHDGTYQWSTLKVHNGTQVSAGDQADINESSPGSSYVDGEMDEATVRIIWTAEGGSSSSVLKEWTGPDA